MSATNPTVITSPASGKASLVTGTEGADNSVVYTAVEDGTAGNSITVAHVAAGNSTPLSVAVASSAITVNLETNGGGTAISTADEVIDAIVASSPASALVSTSSVGASNGTGVVGALTATALANGVAVKVSEVDTTTVLTDGTTVVIPPEADATGRDELSVHEGETPITQIDANSL